MILGKRQGVQRLLQHDLGLTPTGLPAKAAAVLLSPVLPAVAIGHMMLTIARRPA